MTDVLDCLTARRKRLPGDGRRLSSVLRSGELVAAHDGLVGDSEFPADAVQVIADGPLGRIAAVALAAIVFPLAPPDVLVDELRILDLALLRGVIALNAFQDLVDAG